jgi:hypothetical protein
METTLPSLTGELTAPGIMARLKSAMEFLLEIIIKVRGSSLNTGLRSVKHAPARFHSKKSMIARDGSWSQQT